VFGRARVVSPTGPKTCDIHDDAQNRMHDDAKNEGAK
jgi:hypothetical protein